VKARGRFRRLSGQASAVPSPPRTMGTAVDGEPSIVCSVVLEHKWLDRKPGQLRGRNLRVRWRLYDDGAITSRLLDVLDAKGQPLDRRWFLGMDFTEAQERDGGGRRVVLTGHLDPERLDDWLCREGLAS